MPAYTNTMTAEDAMITDDAELFEYTPDTHVAGDVGFDSADADLSSDSASRSRDGTPNNRAAANSSRARAARAALMDVVSEAADNDDDDDANGAFVCLWDGCGMRFRILGDSVAHVNTAHVGTLKDWPKKGKQCTWAQCWRMDPFTDHRNMYNTHAKTKHSKAQLLPIIVEHDPAEEPHPANPTATFASRTRAAAISAAVMAANAIGAPLIRSSSRTSRSSRKRGAEDEEDEDDDENQGNQGSGEASSNGSKRRRKTSSSTSSSRGSKSSSSSSSGGTYRGRRAAAVAAAARVAEFSDEEGMGAAASSMAPLSSMSLTSPSSSSLGEGVAAHPQGSRFRAHLRLSGSTTPPFLDAASTPSGLLTPSSPRSTHGGDSAAGEMDRFGSTASPLSPVSVLSATLADIRTSDDLDQAICDHRDQLSALFPVQQYLESTAAALAASAAIIGTCPDPETSKRLQDMRQQVARCITLLTETVVPGLEGARRARTTTTTTTTKEPFALSGRRRTPADLDLSTAVGVPVGLRLDGEEVSGNTTEEELQPQPCDEGMLPRAAADFDTHSMAAAAAAALLCTPPDSPHPSGTMIASRSRRICA
ncbi:hypothetical protein BC828DRAFT_403846 [Blastocladiella britannica]|nr:hypothetical protein BC828DRAFT_403846 [Blastocladiella britannica]